MLKNSIDNLTNLVPLMIADLLGEAEQKQTVYNDYAVIEFSIKDRFDINTVINMLTREVEINKLYVASYQYCVRFCGFSLPRSSFMWKVEIVTDEDGYVPSIQFTVYTSLEYMYIELSNTLTEMKNRKDIYFTDIMRDTELLLFFQ